MNGYHGRFVLGRIDMSKQLHWIESVEPPMTENSYHAAASMSLWFLRLTIWGPRVPLVRSWYDAASTLFLVACQVLIQLVFQVCLSHFIPWKIRFISRRTRRCFNDRPGSSPPRLLLWWRRESIFRGKHVKWKQSKTKLASLYHVIYHSKAVLTFIRREPCTSIMIMHDYAF